MPQYRYLSVVLNEFIDYYEMAKTVVMSASRVIGLVISKSKAFGSFQYSTFTNLYFADNKLQFTCMER